MRIKEKILIIALAFLARLPTLFVGFYNPDETCYATIGQRLLEGKSLYINIIDHKPPLIYYLYALFDFIGGNHAIFVAHFAMIIIVAATALTLASIIKQIGGSKTVSILAAILYVVAASCGKPNDVAAANAELIFNLPLALFIFCILRAHSLKWIIAGGLIAGIAVLIKPHAAVALPVGIIYLLSSRNKNIALAISFAVPLAIVAIWLYVMERLGEAWYWGVSVNSLYMQGHEEGAALLVRFIKQTLYMFAEQFGLWLPLILSIFFRKGLFSSRDWRLVIWWLVFSILAIFPGSRFFGHYYLQLLPPLCLLSSYAAVNLLEIISWRKKAIVIWILLLSLSFISSWIWAWPLENFRTKFEPEQNKNLIEYLKKEAELNDKIEVWGRFNGIPYLSQHENGTRFLNKNLLSGSFRRDELVQMPERHWELYFEDLEKNKPEWFVDHSSVDMIGASPKEFPQLQKYLLENYKPIATIDGNIIWRRIN